MADKRDCILLWNRDLFKNFSKYCSLYKLNNKLTNKLMGAVTAMMIDKINGGKIEENLLATIEYIIRKIWEQTGLELDPENLEIMFRRFIPGTIINRKLVVETPNNPNNLTLKVKCTHRYTVESKNFVRESNESVQITLPRSRAKELLKFDPEDVISLIERYDFLRPSSGFFWSIHPRVYQFLASCPNSKGEYPIEVIEGFASPYNNNLPKYCSVYAADSPFGSLGNFFDVIETLGDPSDTGYRRWIINPPYTSFVIERTRIAIENRLNSFPDDEFYFLLPAWFSPTLQLIETINIRGMGLVLNEGEHQIYDHVAGVSLTPPIKLFVGYLGSVLTKQNPIFDRMVELTGP